MLSEQSLYPTCQHIIMLLVHSFSYICEFHISILYTYRSSFYGLETLIDMYYSTVLRIVYDNAFSTLETRNYKHCS